MYYETVETAVVNDDETPWIPFTPLSDEVFLKYFKIDPVHGEVAVMLKSPPGIEMAVHHHSGTVIVHTVQGSWKYLEHDWVARPGSVVFETASTKHQPVTLDGDEDVIAFNIVRGELVYSDENDKVIWVESWRTALDRYLTYCKANGITPKDLTSYAL